MKKILSLSAAVCITISGMLVSFADEFDNLQGITAAQKQKLSMIQYNFKEENNSLEMKIMEYNNKIAGLKNDKDKTPEQIALLIAAYERNLETLKNQQKKLKEDTDSSYKSIMSDEQYKQYKNEESAAENAFNDFLKK